MFENMLAQTKPSGSPGQALISLGALEKEPSPPCKGFLESQFPELGYPRWPRDQTYL